MNGKSTLVGAISIPILVIAVALWWASSNPSPLANGETEALGFRADSCTYDEKGYEWCERPDRSAYIRSISAQENEAYFIEFAAPRANAERYDYRYRYTFVWFAECVPDTRVYFEAGRYGQSTQLDCLEGEDRYFLNSSDSRVVSESYLRQAERIEFSKGGFDISVPLHEKGLQKLEQRYRILNAELIADIEAQKKAAAKAELEKQAQAAKRADELKREELARAEKQRKAAAEKRRSEMARLAQIRDCEDENRRAYADHLRSERAARRKLISNSAGVLNMTCDAFSTSYAGNTSNCDRWKININNTTFRTISSVTVGLDAYNVCSDDPKRKKSISVAVAPKSWSNTKYVEMSEKVAVWHVGLLTSGWRQTPFCTKLLEVKFSDQFTPKRCPQ